MFLYHLCWVHFLLCILRFTNIVAGSIATAAFFAPLIVTSPFNFVFPIYYYFFQCNSPCFRYKYTIVCIYLQDVINIYFNKLKFKANRIATNVAERVAIVLVVLYIYSCTFILLYSYYLVKYLLLEVIWKL